DGPLSSEAELAVFDVRGRKVAVLLRGNLAGSTSLRWDGRDRNGRTLSGGIYFARLLSAGIQTSRRIAHLSSRQRSLAYVPLDGRRRHSAVPCLLHTSA